MEEQEVNAANGDLEQEIADAENLLNDEQVNDETASDAGDSPEVKEEQTGEQSDDDLGHSEKSRYGRKFKYIEKQLSRIDRMEQMLEKALSKNEPVAEEDELPDLPTGKDVLDLVDKRLDKREKERADREESARLNYQRRYVELLQEACDGDDDLEDLLTDPKSPFNKTSDKGYFGDPAQDLLLNVSRAQKALRSGMTKEQIKVRGKAPSTPSGVNIPKKETPSIKRKVDTSKWDRDERALAESGMFTDEELAAIARL